eukprot:555623-Prymnesium_polylepis.1
MLLHVSRLVYMYGTGLTKECLTKACLTNERKEKNEIGTLLVVEDCRRGERLSPLLCRVGVSPREPHRTLLTQLLTRVLRVALTQGVLQKVGMLGILQPNWIDYSTRTSSARRSVASARISHTASLASACRKRLSSK